MGSSALASPATSAATLRTRFAIRTTRAAPCWRSLLVSVDFETGQTGRATLVVSLAVGGDGDLAGLVATTDELPRGNGLLAARWGHILQDAVWSALLAIAQDLARAHGGVPIGISAVPGLLKFVSGGAVSYQGVRA